MKKGRYPGGKKAGIFSEKVWNGGASNEKVRDLLMAQRRKGEEEEEMRMRKRNSRSTGLGRIGSSRANTWYGKEERTPVGRTTSVQGK